MVCVLASHSEGYLEIHLVSDWKAAELVLNFLGQELTC